MRKTLVQLSTFFLICFYTIVPAHAFTCDNEGNLDFTHGTILIKFEGDNSLYLLSENSEKNLFPGKAGTNWQLIVPLKGLTSGRMAGGSAGVMFVKRAVKPAGGNFNKRVVYASKLITTANGRKRVTDSVPFKIGRYNSFHKDGGNLRSLIEALHLNIFDNNGNTVYSTYQDEELRQLLVWDLEGTEKYQKRIYGQRFKRDTKDRCYYYDPGVASIAEAGPIVSEIVQVVVGAQRTKLSFSLTLE